MTFSPSPLFLHRWALLLQDFILSFSIFKCMSGQKIGKISFWLYKLFNVPVFPAENGLRCLVKWCFVTAFVCEGYFNKVPQTGWLTQQKFILSQFWRLEGISCPRSTCRQGWFLLRLWGRMFHASAKLLLGCWQSLVFLGLDTHHHDLCLHIHMASNFALFIRTPVILN